MKKNVVKKSGKKIPRSKKKIRVRIGKGSCSICD